MTRVSVILIGLSFLSLSLHAQEVTMPETERQELLAKSDSLFAAGVDLYNNGKFEEAIPIFAQSDQIDKAVLDSTSNRRDYSAIWLASCYYLLGDSVKAKETHEYYYNAAPVDRRLTVKSDSLSAAGRIALDNGDLENALTYFEQCAEIEKAVVGEEHVWYMNTLSFIAFSCFKLADYIYFRGDSAEVIRLCTEALDIWEKVYGKENADYATLLNKLANYNSFWGNYTEAIRLGTEALNIREEVCGRENSDYANSLDDLALYNSSLGNYAEAIRLGTEALNIREVACGRENSDYANSLSNLAGYYLYLGNYAEAIRLGTEAMNIRKGVLWKEHPDYALSLDGLACYNASLGNYAEAIQFATEAMNIYEKIYGKEHPRYAVSLGNLANYNSSSGNYAEAIRLGTEAMNFLKKVYSAEHPNYITSLENLACYYFYSRDIESTNYYSLQYSELASVLIKETFAGQTSSQRQQFWEKYKTWYEETVHRISYVLPSDTLTMSGYNGALLSKGLLLNSEIEFSKLIQESGDDAILDLYENLRTMKTQIFELWEGYASADSIKLVRMRQIADSLNRESDKVEQELVERSKVYGDFTKNLVITWEQVQEQLTDKDIAVEFVSFPLNADSTMYIAYALRKDWKCPKMIPLFEEKQLLAVQKGDRYTTDSISRLVWKPLDDVMLGVERVYFAPSGELYNIAIESIPTHEDGGETLIGEHRDFYRLSSTRELALIKDKNNWQEAAVYGGLQYGMSVEDMIKDDAKYEKRDAATRSDSSPSYYVTREDREGRDVSVSVEIKPLSYLKGTLEEAIAIKEDLERQSVSTQLFTDDVGTETSFKNLHGRKTSIIHIGTHGFFNDRKKKYEENNLQLLGIDRQAKVIEDDALTRSGLYFAGADSARINGSSAIPDGIDDGKLTALEIAQLDLRGLDLVVLSACQTGLGEITGDGVFGLQRGFKKAGAQTIVMSLWKVDDEATTEFMTTFFENIKIDRDGHPLNKHEAFKEAQSKLKQDKDKYSDPYCWAAFVMLDGIN